jgi:hypothetical protein
VPLRLNGSIRINVALNTSLSRAPSSSPWARTARCWTSIYEIDALTMRNQSKELAAIQALPLSKAAKPDAVRNWRPDRHK